MYNYGIKENWRFFDWIQSIFRMKADVFSLRKDNQNDTDE